MPQFNLYPAIAELLAADLILVYKDSIGAVKTITAEDFASSIKALTSRAFSVDLVNSAVTLDQTNEFVVGNSGASFNVTLPLSADNAGISFYISNKGTGQINLLSLGGDTIDGAASLPMAQYVSFIVIADGVDMWHAFGLTA